MPGKGRPAINTDPFVLVYFSGGWEALYVDGKRTGQWGREVTAAIIAREAQALALREGGPVRLRSCAVVVPDTFCLDDIPEKLEDCA